MHIIKECPLCQATTITRTMLETYHSVSLDGVYPPECVSQNKRSVEPIGVFLICLKWSHVLQTGKVTYVHPGFPTDLVHLTVGYASVFVLKCGEMYVERGDGRVA